MDSKDVVYKKKKAAKVILVVFFYLRSLYWRDDADMDFFKGCQFNRIRKKINEIRSEGVKTA